MDQKWSIIGRGWSQTPPRRFWVTFGTNHFFTKTSKNHETSRFMKTDFCRKTLSSKVDLIWHLCSILKVENARTLILFLSSFLQISSKTGLSRPKHNLLLHVFDLNPSFSWKNTFSFGAIWDLFISNCIIMYNYASWDYVRLTWDYVRLREITWDYVK